jgi:hypothetical protein
LKNGTPDPDVVEEARESQTLIENISVFTFSFLPARCVLQQIFLLF